jgi:hypothetical protein
MTSKTSIPRHISVAVLLFAASQVIATRAATAPIIVNPPTTIVNPCPLGTVPETTTGHFLQFAMFAIKYFNLCGG